ncbi:hypothetical protein MTR67_051376 [Solanum verrucosum]|uniref:Uncharacterized protein n=1 Tax=Solanum verrucosum TaxID=315347 RepID=A0AAF1A029_SOLVR|nr:hypothetical protein MTR67_051376 [Solanum verrucosum]
MPNYERERLNSRFSITMHRTQYSKLKNFNDTTHFKNAQLRGFMQNYGHEQLNSRTSWSYGSWYEESCDDKVDS